jgi:hypothetical protein
MPEGYPLVWAVFAIVLSVGLAHFVRVRRDKHNVSVAKIAEHQKRRKAMVAIIDHILDSLDEQKPPLVLWKDTLQDLNRTIGAYADILEDRLSLDEAWHQYQSIDQRALDFDKILGKDGWTTNYRRSIAVMRPLLEKLKK